MGARREVVLTEDQKQMVEDNRFLAVKYVTDHIKIRGNVDVNDRDDMIQEMMIAIARAVVTYDPSRGALSTHAYNWMGKLMIRYTHGRHIVRTPEHTWTRGGTEWTRSAAESARSARVRSVSPDDSIESPDVGSDLNADDLAAWVRGEIERLDDDDRIVLTRRLGCDTFESIARDVRLRRNTVSRIEKQACKRIFDAAVSRGILDPAAANRPVRPVPMLLASVASGAAERGARE